MLVRSTLTCSIILALATPAAAEEIDRLAPLPEPETILVTAPRHQAGPDALGTATLDAGVTLYDARFRRVASRDLRDPQVLTIAASLRGLAPDAQLARVKREVERRVRLTTDLEAMGVADYWDNAADTLRRGRGDGEDIAIAEMQALVAAGFPRGDLFVSVGRHRRIGAHAVLIARTATGYTMLDAAESAPIDADRAGPGRFTPIVSVGARGSWLHGFRRPARIAAR